MAESSRHIYLKKKSLPEALSILFERFGSIVTGEETIPTARAAGRVLACGVSAAVSSPAHHLAAMDGIAVKAEETFGASEATPLLLEIGKSAFFVNTGNLLPPGTNAVIMIEDVNIVNETAAEIISPAYPWQHVRKAGEDVVATELLFPTRHVITPYCIGALLSAGVLSVKVRKKPNVLIIPTGDEIVDWEDGYDPSQAPAGKVLDSNSYMLAALVESCKASCDRHPVVGDDPEEITGVLKTAVESGKYQAVLIIGGSSAGAMDYSRVAISSLGEILVHGVTIMPGKPIIIGSVNSIPVFGMPGYPVSAVVCFEEIVRPLLCRMQGIIARPKETVKAVLAKKAASRLGVEEFLRVKLGKVGEEIVATQLPRGAGSVTSLADADAFVRIPPDTEGLPEGQVVTAELLRPHIEIEKTVVIVGSHDNTLDVIADMVAARNRGIRIASSHVGSMAGLTALAKGRCHAAGSHLLDPGTGAYNVPFIEKLLPGMPTKLVKLVSRHQGLMVKPGNPLGITGIQDLAKKGVRFVNRQPGSGTRILLDHRLEELGIDPSDIEGYANEEYTHMSVAVAVASNAADTGLGILAAARALGLDFVPVVCEQYDLVIPARFFELPGIRAIMEVIRSREFAQRVEALGGYSTEETGRVVDIG